MRRLIINADDFGDPRFNSSIESGFSAGFISSTSLLVTSIGASDAVRLMRDQELSIGLHLNLTTDGPLSPAVDVPSLVDTRGGFHGINGLRHRLRRNAIRDEDIGREISAQIAHFRSLVGSDPSHVDGHHHVHMEPKVARCVAPILREGGITRIRAPLEAVCHFADVDSGRRRRGERLMDATRMSLPIYRDHGCRWPDHFMGIGLGWDRCAITRLEKRLRAIPEGITEYMVHVLRRGDVPHSDAAFRRHYEYDVLSSETFSELLEREGILLTSFLAIGQQTERMGV